MGDRVAVEEVRSLEEEVRGEVVKLKEQLDATERKLAVALQERDASSRQAALTLQEANRVLDERLGGDWTSLLLVTISLGAGMAAGYFGQRWFDKRVPWLALVGTGVFIGGLGMRKKHWATRLSMMGSGFTMAATSVAYVIKMPAPTSRPTTTNGGAAA